MANKTIPDLSTITSPTSNALLWINDSTASPQDRSLSLANLLGLFLGTGWKAILKAAIGSGWATALASALGTNWTTALGAALGTGWATPMAITYTGPTSGAGDYGMPGFFLYSPGDATVLITVISSSYVKVAEYKCPVAGTVRVKSRMVDNGGTGYCRIYNNGSPVGSEHSVGTTITTFSDDITVAQGDLISIYMKTSVASSTYVQLFEFALCSNGYGPLIP